jgi:hypothetical protein
MTTRSAIVLAGCLVAGCGAPQAVAPSEQALASASPTTAASASAASEQTTPTPPATAASPLPTAEPGTGAFTVCPKAVDGPVCPLPPAKYTAAVHDQFTFSIPEAGWQEERAVAGEFETRVVLSRVDDADQRLTFLSGQTGPTSPAAVDPAAFAIPGFKAGQPTPIKIAGTAAEYIDLEPAGAQGASAVTIETQTIRIEPDRRYRFTVARIPMMEEAATVIMVTEAPVASFSTFLPAADAVLETVGFY